MHAFRDAERNNDRVEPVRQGKTILIRHIDPMDSRGIFSGLYRTVEGDLSAFKLRRWTVLSGLEGMMAGRTATTSIVAKIVESVVQRLDWVAE